MTKYFLSTALAGLSAALISFPVQAGDMEDKIVGQLTEAYGGDKLTSLKFVYSFNDIRGSWIGQGQTPEFLELEPTRREQYFDLKNMHASAEAVGGAGSFNNRVIVKDGMTKNVDYLENVYSETSDGGYYQSFGGSIRSNDLLLAYEVAKNPEAATYKGTKYYQNAPHYLLELDMEGTTFEPLIWINSESGRISRMERQMPDFKFQYVFADYKLEKGVTYAGEFTLYIDDTLVQYTKSRTVKVNRLKSSAFEIAKNILPEPDTIDNSEMNVDLVTPGVYHTGQGGSFSTFVDAGDHLIGIGLYGGLKARYDAYTEAHGAKPLKYVIATHHHEDHVGGTADALELGAVLVAPKQTKAALVTKVGPIADSSLELIDGKTHSVGPVDMHIINTPHAKNYAVVYIPSAKAVFEEDHYGGRFTESASRVNRSGVVFRNEVARLGLDVETLLSGHGRKQESWAAFSASADNHVPGSCPTGRKICRDMN